MSTVRETPAGGADKPLLKPSQNCWSCRLVSGGGLMLSAAYVFHAAQKVRRQGGPTSAGTVAQLVFAAGLAVWGIVVITDLRGKTQKT